MPAHLLISFTLAFCFAVIGSSAHASENWKENIAQEIYTAVEKGEPLPTFEIAPEDRNTEAAYAIQRLYVEKRIAGGATIGGFKAALTAPPQRERFGTNESAWAPLFKEGLIWTNASDLAQVKLFPGMMLETELAFKIGKKIEAPVKDIITLKNFVESVHPAIELPQVYVKNKEAINYFDTVASSIGSKLVIVGKGHPVSSVTPNKVDVVLKHNGKVENAGKGSDAVDGQWETLLWLVNSAINGGYSVEPGHVFITGAMGRMVPARVGEYEAHYSFEQLRFVVED